MKSISDFDLCTQPVKFLLASPVHCSAFPLVWYSLSPLSQQRLPLDNGINRIVYLKTNEIVL
jgi:hypothetical protein